MKYLMIAVTLMTASTPAFAVRCSDALKTAELIKKEAAKSEPQFLDKYCQTLKTQRQSIKLHADGTEQVECKSSINKAVLADAASQCPSHMD